MLFLCFFCVRSEYLSARKGEKRGDWCWVISRQLFFYIRKKNLEKSWLIAYFFFFFFPPQMVFISILIMNAICPFTLIGEYKPTMNKTYWPIPPLIRSVWCVSQAVILRRQKVILYVGFGRVIFSVLPTFSYCFITWTYS